MNLVVPASHCLYKTMTIEKGLYADIACHSEYRSWRSLESSLPWPGNVANDPQSGQALLALSWIVLQQYYQQGMSSPVGVLDLLTSRKMDYRSALRVLDIALDQDRFVCEELKSIQKQISDSSITDDQPATNPPAILSCG